MAAQHCPLHNIIAVLVIILFREGEFVVFRLLGSLSRECLLYNLYAKMCDNNLMTAVVQK